MIRTIICDDEEATIIILKKLIDSFSLPLEIVGIAKDGKEAVKFINKHKPDLVFLDIRMPYYNGFEVMEKIEKTSVIIITAFDTFEYAREALRYGVKDILVKPIGSNDLKVAINRAIGWNITEDPLVNTALEYIHNNYKEDINLQDVSEYVFCSNNHLARIFKKTMDTTIMNYIHKIRIEKAIQILELKESSIQEISEKVGYNNINNFYKHFKNITGSTPLKYIKGE